MDRQILIPDAMDAPASRGPHCLDAMDAPASRMRPPFSRRGLRRSSGPAAALGRFHLAAGRKVVMISTIMKSTNMQKLERRRQY